MSYFGRLVCYKTVLCTENLIPGGPLLVDFSSILNLIGFDLAKFEIDILCWIYELGMMNNINRKKSILVGS